MFVDTKARAQELGQLLDDAGMPTSVMHGEQMQVGGLACKGHSWRTTCMAA